MGLMDDVLGQMSGVAAQHGATDDHSAELMNAVAGMLAGGKGLGAPSARGGGLGDLSSLVNGFQQAGLGNLVDSWVGTGANHAPSPTHIEQGLGGDVLAQLAKKAGISPQVAASLLAVGLPILIDKLTPKGQVPPQSSLESSLGGLLGGLLRGN